MQTLDNKIPPPVVALLFALLSWAISLVTPVFDVSLFARLAVAGLIASVGAGFCVAGVMSFIRAKTTVNPLKPETATTLVSSGIYRVSRNPMYAGFAFFLLSWIVYLSSPVAALGVLGFVIYMNRFQIEPEERALQAVFGEEFENYKSQVRRWL